MAFAPVLSAALGFQGMPIHTPHAHACMHACALGAQAIYCMNMDGSRWILMADANLECGADLWWLHR